jgi:putative FmdB family regulatory protein
MPFYEYQCSACGHHHEELQKVSDRSLRKCPACGRPALKRLVSAPVFRLKGGGWYETDFKNDKEAKRNLAGEKEPAPEKPAEAKPDGKPEAAKPAVKEASETRKEKPAPRPPASVRRRRIERKKGAARRPRR